MGLILDGFLFGLYGVLLLRVWKVWRAACTAPVGDCKKVNLLTSILWLLALCTAAFMLANVYALHLMDRTLLSMKVFQAFAVGNFYAYWLVLDLVSKDTETD